ncbi:MAG: O-antigen ligase family protein [Candidatus Saccharibacteria bacterium]|nr:O-antigen ligase family protein [Candidatus Saccharibacteria bacterium]
MKKSVSRINKLLTVLLYFFPLALFFSYHPVISLGSSETMNFEFSIAEIYLLIFALTSLADLKNFFKYYGKRLIPFVLFPLYAGLSAIWSPNHLRAVFTTGLLGILIYVALEINLIFRQNDSLKNTLRRYLVQAAVIISAFCWLQCLLDVLGVPRTSTGLCEGCVYDAFGFPHPNGFAIEPQFMGNLLLVPALLSIYNLIYEEKLLFKKKYLQTIITIFLIATLFLTMSRGAIYAFGIGLAIIFILRFPVIKYNGKKSNKTTWLLIPITLAGFLISLTTQGALAQVSPTKDTFWTGVTKTIHQLSLGKVDLRPTELKNQPEEKPEETKPETETPAQSEDTSSKFSGYVEQSTAFRSQLTKDALDIWNDSPKNLLFGTGLGSAGIKLLEKDSELGTPKEIVQNQYASTLLELGLVGLILAVVIFAATLAFGLSDFSKNPLLIGASAAFLVSLFFFGGLPNALHVYLFPLLLANPTIQRASRHKE